MRPAVFVCGVRCGSLSSFGEFGKVAVFAKSLDDVGDSLPRETNVRRDLLLRPARQPQIEAALIACGLCVNVSAWEPGSEDQRLTAISRCLARLTRTLTAET